MEHSPLMRRLLGAWPEDKAFDPSPTPTPPEKQNPTTASPESNIHHISFKCRTYGDRDHTPCSGTCDGSGPEHGGAEFCPHPCEHWCHRKEAE